MYDNGNTNPDTYTIDAAEVNRPFFGGMFYGADVENLTVWAGTPVNTVNIPSTYFATNTFLNNAGGNDIVNIGEAADGVQSIGGYLQIQNDPAFSVITVNDTGDTAARTATQNTVTLGTDPYGRIGGLAPAIIDYQYWTHRRSASSWGMPVVTRSTLSPMGSPSPSGMPVVWTS
jgi:hypothetical protein